MAGQHVIRLETIGASKSWVARITGPDTRYGLTREFVVGARDYSRANAPRTRGVYTSYQLPDGIYEVNDPQSWSRVERYFLRVVNGEASPILMAEVLDAVTAS